MASPGPHLGGHNWRPRGPYGRRRKATKRKPGAKPGQPGGPQVPTGLKPGGPMERLGEPTQEEIIGDPGENEDEGVQHGPYEVPNDDSDIAASGRGRRRPRSGQYRKQPLDLTQILKVFKAEKKLKRRPKASLPKLPKRF